MLKNFLAVLFLLTASIAATGQQNTPDERPVFLRFPTIPQFKVHKMADSTAFTREDLKKRENTIFFIFSPDCKYCQQETEEIVENLKKFKNTQILMISHYPWDDVMEYYKQYKISNYPQIVMARDGNYFFPLFFGLQNLPATYIYDKKGNLKKSFEGSVKIENILAEL